MNIKCPNYEKCPIYLGILKGKDLTSKAYIQFYCASEKHPTCKRFMVKEVTGICPPDILPNSVLSIDEIIQEYNLKRL